MGRINLHPGDRAPDFELLDETGIPHTLAGYAGRWLALFFYPRDMTALCVKEACAFNDRWEEFHALGAEVLGCSGQDALSHNQMRAACRLRYRLLCDGDGSVRKSWGVSGLLRRRVTFVVDPAGRIRFVYQRLLRGEEHASQALNFLRAGA